MIESDVLIHSSPICMLAHINILALAMHMYILAS